MEHSDTIWRYLYYLLASLSGALTALSLQGWKNMGAMQIVLFILAGTGFGFFVFPVIFQHTDSQQVAGGICFLMASGWNVLLPLAIKRYLPNIGGEK